MLTLTLASSAIIATAVMAGGEAKASFEMVGSGTQAASVESDIVEGFARDMSVEMVAQQIVPANYDVMFDSAVDRSAKTSWAGGRAWQSVLADALAPLGLAYRVEENKVLISFADFAGSGSSDNGKNDGMMASDNMMMSSDDVMMMEESVAEEIIPMPVVEEVEEWRAVAGKTLQEVLAEWSEESGWALAWQSERDYPLRASASFYGDFETAAGNLLRAFSVAEPPVRATMYRGNRVIVVTTGVDNEN